MDSGVPRASSRVTKALVIALLGGACKARPPALDIGSAPPAGTVQAVEAGGALRAASALAALPPTGGLDAACVRGNVTACLEVGERYESAADPVERERAITAFDSACSSGHHAACVRWARLLAVQSDRDSLRPCQHFTEVRMLDRLLSACDRGEIEACREAARRTAGPPVWILQEIEGKRLVSFLSAACSKHVHEACWTLAQMHLQDRVVPLDYVKAVQLGELACDGGVRDACAGIGRFLATGQDAFRDAGKAARALARACDETHFEDCRMASGFFQRGEGVPTDAEHAIALLQRACRTMVLNHAGNISCRSPNDVRPHPRMGCTTKSSRVSQLSISRFLNSRLHVIAGCHFDRATSDGGAYIGKLGFTVEKNGTVKSATTTPPMGPDADTCIARSLLFPSPEGGKLTVVVPLTLEER